MKVHVRVTKADIKKGWPDEGDACPIARALKRRHPSREVEVGYEEFALLWNRDEDPFGDRPLYAVLPPEAGQFIKAFDAGLPVEPIEFDLEFSEREP